MTGHAFDSCQIEKQPLCRDPVIPSKHESIRCNAQVDAHIRDDIAILIICIVMSTYLWSRDWSRSGGSYGNNTRVICYPTSRECCCRNYRPTMLNRDYDMNKQFGIKLICDKIRSKLHQIEQRRLLPPLWRHASSRNDASCSFTHPVVNGPRARGTSLGT